MNVEKFVSRALFGVLCVALGFILRRLDAGIVDYVIAALAVTFARMAKCYDEEVTMFEF